MSDISENNDPPGPYGSVFLKNYKAFGPSGQSLALSRINLFFGPNSSGKSSVFKAIKLVVNAFLGKPITNHAFSTTVHKGRRDEEIVIGLCFRHPHRSIDCTPTFYFHFSERPEDRIGLDVVDVVLPSNITLKLRPAERGLAIGGCDLSLDAFRELLPDKSRLTEERLDQYREFLCNSVSESQCPLNTLAPGKRFLDTTEDIPQDLVFAFEKVIIEGLYLGSDGLAHLENNLVHLPPIRRIPTRSELVQLSQSGTDFLEDVETRTWEVLLKKRYNRYLNETNFWMGEKGLSLGYSMMRKSVEVDGNCGPTMPEGEPPTYLAVRDTTDPEMDTVDLDLTDVGVGVSQVIPVICTSCIHNELWIMIEQPELHLHPRIQCQLGDLFIAKSKDHISLGNPNSGNVFLVETHSEHLVLRMLRRVRETSNGVRAPDNPFALQPEDLSIFIFQPNRETGVQVHRMEIAPDGDFADAWPDGFFPERLRELR